MKELTHHELEAIVPVIGQTVKVEDIPEPYRSMFLRDSLGSTIPAPNTHYVWDWQKWLAIHFRDQKDPKA